jgi:hypothetical protein
LMLTRCYDERFNNQKKTTTRASGPSTAAIR